MSERKPDPTLNSLWQPLRLLLASLEADLDRIYAEANFDVAVKPSFVMELLRLNADGPMTITELARSVERTHSAVSQKVAAMQRDGLVRTRRGADARSKNVALTAKARRVIGPLAAVWRATEAALIELETELPYPLTTVVEDIERALRRRSFYERVKHERRVEAVALLVAKLADDPDSQ